MSTNRPAQFPPVRPGGPFLAVEQADRVIEALIGSVESLADPDFMYAKFGADQDGPDDPISQAIFTFEAMIGADPDQPGVEQVCHGDASEDWRRGYLLGVAAGRRLAAYGVGTSRPDAQSGAALAEATARLAEAMTVLAARLAAVGGAR